MSNPTPTTPAECRAEQERWQKPVEQIKAEWEAIEAKRPGGNFDAVMLPLEMNRARGTSREQNLIVVIDALHATVKGYHAEMGILLAAHAEALELLRDCDTELDDLMRRVRRLAQDAPDDDTTDADELRRRIAALTAQAPASAEGGAE